MVTHALLRDGAHAWGCPLRSLTDMPLHFSSDRIKSTLSTNPSPIRLIGFSISLDEKQFIH